MNLAKLPVAVRQLAVRVALVMRRKSDAWRSIQAWGGFGDGAYLARYPDVARTGVDALSHYLLWGESEGRRPNDLFDPLWYRAQVGLDEQASPLEHYVRSGSAQNVRPTPGFDPAFYRQEYSQTIGSVEPLAHYLTEGAARGCEPNPAFDSKWYRARYMAADTEISPLAHYLATARTQDVWPHPYFDPGHYRSRSGSAAPLTPLEHYLIHGRESGLSPCPVLDLTWYGEQVSEVREGRTDALWHFSTYGVSHGLDPNPAFDTDWYLLSNQDVVDAGADPLAHYLHYGAAEGRKPHPLFDPVWYLRAYPDVAAAGMNALTHFLWLGWREGRDPCPLFDTDWYLARNADVDAAGINPLGHYWRHGWQEGRDPSPFFKARWYLEQNPSVRDAGTEPLWHYIVEGARQDLDPHPSFQTRWYREQHPQAAGWNPLAHFVRVGRPEGLKPSPDFAEFQFTPPARQVGVQPVIDRFESWQEVNAFTSASAARLRARLAKKDAKSLPKISVVMPVYNTEPRLLAEAIASVRAQVYPNWELCIVDDASSSKPTASALKALCDGDPRIRMKRAAQNGNISVASNMAAGMATGEIIALLDHDDVMHPEALGEVALRFVDPEVDVVYSDDDKIDMDGRRYDPQFKPGWSPSLLLSFMYFSHLFTFRRSLFESVGGFRVGFEGSQDYDLALRLTEKARKVDHIPRILYHWRAAPGSTAVSGDAKGGAFDRGVKAVADALRRRDIKGKVVQPDWARAAGAGVYETRFPDSGPRVCIIIPTRNKLELLRTCVESIARTSYKNYEVLILDNESDDKATLAWLKKQPHRVLRVASPEKGFSFAALNNAGVKATDAEYVLLLNNDTEVTSPRWLSQMMGYAQMEGVGAVGARLLYGDGRVQHAGITHGLHEGMAGHAFKLLPEWSGGYMTLAKTSREVAGVTAACMLTPRELYQRLGGLDETNFAVAYNDVDYSYRVVDAGLTCVYCASAELFHYEGQTRGFVDNPAEITAMRHRYGSRTDAWHNPNLSLDNEQFEIARTRVAAADELPAKVAVVSHNLNHEGAPNSLFELSHGLSGAGIETLCLSPFEGPLRAKYEEAGIAVHTVLHPLTDYPDSREFEDRLDTLGQSLLFHGVTVVVANTAESFWAVAAAKRVGIPALWIIRESEPWETYYSQMPAHLSAVAYGAFAQAYRVVFVAQSTLDAWKPLDSRSSFTLIRNGLDVQRLIADMAAKSRAEGRKLSKAAAGDVVFTCVGTVSDRKGQLDLIQAYARLPETVAAKARVCIVGDRPGPYSDRLHAEVAKLDAKRRKRVQIVGETGAAKTYLVGADVFVCCSRVESYPRVTLEAMAAGLPIITTPVWGIREQVREGYNADFYEPGNAEALAAHMTAMIEHPDRRALYASRAKPVFESLPDYDHMLRSYQALVRDAAGAV